MSNMQIAKSKMMEVVPGDAFGGMTLLSAVQLL